MKQGDTFLGGGEVHGADHLWIVINDPSAHAGVALTVNVSTLRLGAETTCLLGARDHPFLRHRSYVRYGSARKANAADLDKLVQVGRFKAHRAASAALLQKVRAGARVSALFARELRTLL